LEETLVATYHSSHQLINSSFYPSIFVGRGKVQDEIIVVFIHLFGCRHGNMDELRPSHAW